jgi:hypothetical protein
MKSFILLLVLIPAVMLIGGECRGEDLGGVQPPAPYGVFSTLSAESPGAGQAALAVALEKSGEPDFSRYTSLLAIGITESIEVGLTLPYVDNSSDGLEDVSFSLKHRFREEDGYVPALAYLIAAALDSGSEEYGTEGYAGAGVVASKRLGPVNGHLNLIYTVPGDSDLDGAARFSAGIDFSAAHNLMMLGEFYAAESYYSDRTDRLEARFGYRFLSGEGVFTTLGVGFGLNDRTPEYRLMASIALFFPRIERPVEKVYEEG